MGGGGVGGPAVGGTVEGVVGASVEGVADGSVVGVPVLPQAQTERAHTAERHRARARNNLFFVFGSPHTSNKMKKGRICR